VRNVIDVTEAPYNAVCNNSADDWDAIQRAHDDLKLGGLMIIPGVSKISQPLAISKPISFRGLHRTSTGLFSFGDEKVLTIADNIAVEVSNMGLYGFQDANATANVCEVGINADVTFRDLNIWGGLWALKYQGSDSTIDNCFISGAGAAGGCVYSQGSGWWKRVKCDKGAFAQQFCFMQGSPVMPGTIEQSFVQCDFSGDYQSSFYVDDGGARVVSCVLSQCVTSSQIIVGTALWLAFGQHRFGAGINVVGPNVPITVADSLALTRIGVNSTVKHLSNNINIQ